MKKTMTAIKRAGKVVLEETLRPRQFEVRGKFVVCSHCGSDGFQWHGHGAFGTRYKALFIDGYTLECCQCSHVETFAKRPTEH